MKIKGETERCDTRCAEMRWSALRSRINAPRPLPPPAHLIYLKKEIWFTQLLLGPPNALTPNSPLLNFWIFCSRSKKIWTVQNVPYYSKFNKIEWNRFFQMFSFSILLLNKLVKTKRNGLCLRVAVEH